MRRLLPVLVCLLCACAEDPADFSLELSPGGLELVPPGVLELKVRARWYGNVREPVEVELRNLPAGMAELPVFTLSPEAPEQTLTLDFPAEAAAGTRRLPVVGRTATQVRWQTASLVVRASGGTLDKSFGRGGVSRVCDISRERTLGAKVTPEGEILVIGQTTADLEVATLQDNGTPVRGSGRSWLYRFLHFETLELFAADYDASHRRVVAATSADEGAQLLAVKLSPNELDASFGESGLRTTRALARVGGMARQATGGLALVGPLASDASALGVVRLDTFGKVQRRTGSDSDVWLSVPMAGPVELGPVVLDPEARVVFAGREQGPEGTRDFLVRLDSRGELDPTFGLGGVQRLSLSADGAKVTALLPLSDKNLALGALSRTRALVARLLPSGAADPAFGEGGVVWLREATSAPVRLQPRPNGGLYAATSVRTGPADLDFAVVALKSSGAVDEGFGDAGWRVTPVAAGEDVLEALELISDRSLLLAGTAKDSRGSCFGLARIWQ